MAVTSGFFNSINGDRKYNAEQMSAIFDGIINDGVFANIGTAFAVKSGEGNTVNVGIGRAWFNSTWIYNDAILPVSLEASELVLDRIDAIVFEVDRTNEVRNGTIKAIKGTPGSSPQNPEMASTDYVHQYPVSFILRKAGSTTITQANITNMVGTSSCPYVTGILQVQNIDNIVAQWQAQWIEWFAKETTDTEAQAQEIISDWNQWYTNQTGQSESQMSQWMSQMQSDFNLWLASLKDAIGEDPAATLANEIVELQNKFDTLMREKCIYDVIEDSTGQFITDSDELAIEGKVVFGAEGSPGTNTEVPVDNTRLISTYTHVKSGTVHNFYGRGENGRAKITDDFISGDTFAVNGVTVPAYVGNDTPDDDTIVKDRWVTFVFDGTAINFSSGGGLTNNKLAKATAKPRDVVSSASFYSGTKTLQNGTMVDHAGITSAISVSHDGSRNLFARIPYGAYRTDAGTGYPEIEIAKATAISELGLAERGQYQTAGGIGGGGSSSYYTFNNIPEGIYRKNGASWAPEIRLSKSTVLNYIMDSSSMGQYKQALAYNGGSLSKTFSMTAGRIILFVLHGACTDGNRPSVSLSTPGCTNLVNYDSGEYTQDAAYMVNHVLIRVVKVNSTGTATAKVTGNGDRAVAFIGAWTLVP